MGCDFYQIMNDRILGIVTLLLSIFYIYATSIIEISFISDVVGPKKFPYIISFFLFISSIWLIAFPKHKADWPHLSKIIEVFVTAAIFLVYANILSYVGFVISTIFLSAYISWRMGANLMTSLIYGTFVSVVIFILFNYVLGLSLAKNALGF